MKNEIISQNLENMAEDLDMFREACEIFGLEKFAYDLANMRRDLRQYAAAIKRPEKPRRAKIKLAVNNVEQKCEYDSRRTST